MQYENFMKVLGRVAVSFLCNKKERITKRGIVAAAMCGFILSITMLIGLLTENEEIAFKQTFTAGIQLAFYLFTHTVLLGIVILYLFIKFEERGCQKQAAGTMYGSFLKNHFGGGKQNLVFNYIMLVTILYYAFSSQNWRWKL